MERVGMRKTLPGRLSGVKKKASRDGNPGEEAADDFVRGDAFGFGFVGGEDPVAEDFRGEGFDVRGGDEGAAFEEGSGAGGAGEAEGAAG